MNANPPWRWTCNGDAFELIATRDLKSACPGAVVIRVTGRNGAYLVRGSGLFVTLRIGAPCPVRRSRNPNRPHYPREPKRIKSFQDLLKSAEAIARHHGLHRPPETRINR